MNIARLLIIVVTVIIPVAVMAQPGAILQGGDNISNAYIISALPFSDTGTTAGFIDDYAGSCGSNGGAPDVVYSYTASYDEYLTISLCRESNFDTRLYIFENNPSNEYACTDDDCANQYSSLLSHLECLQLNAGHTYYIVIDGYGGAFGRYSIDIVPPIPGIPFYGIVSESGGGPIGGATVRILDGGYPVWQDTTDNYGLFEVVFLPDGSYLVEASKIGYIPQTSGPYLVNVCRSNIVNFALEPSGPPPIGSIVGTVTDSISGFPLEGALVLAFINGNIWGSDSSDASGYYAINELQVVPHVIEASQTGYITKIIPGVEVIADDSVRLNIAISPISQPCDLTPPPDAIIEVEPDCYDDYVDIYNGGCHYDVWDTIPANSVFFGGGGTFNYLGSEYRDSDWLEFELEDSSHVTLQGVAEYELQIVMLRQGPVTPCIDFEVLFTATAPACSTASVSCDLGPGRYWAWTGSFAFSGVECGSDYILTLSSIPYGGCAYIPGDIGGSNVPNGIDVVYGVNFFKGGTPPIIDCGTPVGPCPQATPFYAAGDVNGSCVFNGIDITFFVNYLKGIVPELLFCPTCPPGN